MAYGLKASSCHPLTLKSWDTYICDVIKQNELELANIDFQIWPNRGDKFFVSCCFCTPSTACIFGTNWPISVGSVVKVSFASDVYNQSEISKLNLTDFGLILKDCITYVALKSIAHSLEHDFQWAKTCAAVAFWGVLEFENYWIVSI